MTYGPQYLRPKGAKTEKTPEQMVYADHLKKMKEREKHTGKEVAQLPFQKSSSKNGR